MWLAPRVRWRHQGSGRGWLAQPPDFLEFKRANYPEKQSGTYHYFSRLTLKNGKTKIRNLDLQNFLEIDFSVVSDKEE